MLLRAVCLVLGAVLLAPSPTSAERGVAVDLGVIEIDRPLAGGGTYRLPVLGVRNPGDQVARYSMGIGQTGANGASELGADWFTFTPAGFELEPGQTVPVAISMRLPRDVEPGQYEGLLRAELVAEGEGALVAAAAGARLTFEVAPSSGLDALLREIGGFITGLPTWLYALLLMAAFVTVGVWASRRFTLRVERRG